MRLQDLGRRSILALEYKEFPTITAHTLISDLSEAGQLAGSLRPCIRSSEVPQDVIILRNLDLAVHPVDQLPKPMNGMAKDRTPWFPNTHPHTYPLR